MYACTNHIVNLYSGPISTCIASGDISRVSELENALASFVSNGAYMSIIINT